MFKSIFGRMFWTYAMLLVFVLSSVSMVITGLLSHFVEQKQVEYVSVVAKTIEDWTVSMQIENHDSISVQTYNRFLHSWGRLTSSDITVVGRNGEVFDSTCGIKIVPEKIINSIELDKPYIFKSNFNDFYKNKVLSVSFPMHYKGNVIGAIIFNKSIPELRGAVFDLLTLFIMSSLLALAITFVIVYFQARKISAPIAKINKAAQNIAKGDFSQRVDITSRDEIGQLASTFNFMASSIEKSDKNKQRFISDVSHELRTPMTSITGFVQGMLDGTISDDERDGYLEIVLDESTRLTKLVNDMLEMSKMQSDKFKINISPFDINDLVCSVLISLESKIENLGLDVDVDFRPEHLVVLGDKDQIKRVLLNLIDNAAKFSIPNTQITIKTAVKGGKAHIFVSNIGEEIPPEDLKHIFDRFYKTDKSRQRDKSGAGLGLSLVQNILMLHHQSISVTNTKNENDNNYTTTFEFTLEIK